MTQKNSQQIHGEITSSKPTLDLSSKKSTLKKILFWLKNYVRALISFNKKTSPLPSQQQSMKAPIDWHSFFICDIIDSNRCKISTILTLAAFYRHGYGVEKDESLALQLEDAMRPENYKQFILELVIFERDVQATGPFIDGLCGLGIMTFAGDDWEKNFKPILESGIEKLTGDEKILVTARVNELEEMVQYARDLKKKGFSKDKINEEIMMEIDKRWLNYQVERFSLNEPLEQNPEEISYDFLLTAIFKAQPNPEAPKEEKEQFLKHRDIILDPKTCLPGMLKTFAVFYRTGYGVKKNEAMAKQLEDAAHPANYKGFILELAVIGTSKWSGSTHLEGLGNLSISELSKDWEKYQAALRKKIDRMEE